MHIIIGVLTAIGGVIWALYRLQNSGVDLNSFNPFHWMRRRKWEKKIGVKPLHSIDKPMEAAAVLIVAALKTEGEVSREQKLETIDIFKKEFNLDNSTATELFSSSSFLLQDVADLISEVRHILAPTKELFSPEQSSSTIDLIKRASLLDGSISDIQYKLIGAVTNALLVSGTREDKWS